ncbi:hypothetical protein FOZ63_018543 [Perkinsus olseni]|uniref:Uncharacterized protein n=1 Tax=Perkinsus olseni TaxID=32597 RepID=A0A7J6QX87_PEROL|nr:hypothetical protein FOZ63_018543 [Perkinsus olseni]
MICQRLPETDVFSDECNGHHMSISFGVPGQPVFTDGPYRLRRTRDGYTVEFPNCKGASYWYENFAKFFSETEGHFQEGDLVNIEYLERFDTAYVRIAGSLYEIAKANATNADVCGIL